MQNFTLSLYCRHLSLPIITIHTFLCLRSSDVYTYIIHTEGTGTNVAVNNDSSHIFVLCVFRYLHFLYLVGVVRYFALSHNGGQVSRGFYVRGLFSRGENILGGECPGGEFLGGILLRGQLSGGISPGGFCLGGDCPDPKYDYVISPKYFVIKLICGSMCISEIW